MPVPTTPDLPVASGSCFAAYDGVDRYLVLTCLPNDGSDATTWVGQFGGHWSSVNGAEPHGLDPVYSTLAYDPDVREVLLIGDNYTVYDATVNNTSRPCMSAWAFAGGNWSSTLPPSAPCLSQLASAYDPHDGYLLVHGGWLGGNSFVTDQTLSETWTFNGTAWTRISAPGPPLGLTWGGAWNGMGAGMAYDPAAGGVILVESGLALDNGASDSETWSFVDGNWTDLNTSTPYFLGDAYDHTVGYDPQSGALVAVGLWGAGDPVQTVLFVNGSWHGDGCPDPSVCIPEGGEGFPAMVTDPSSQRLLDLVPGGNGGDALDQFAWGFPPSAMVPKPSVAEVGVALTLNFSVAEGLGPFWSSGLGSSPSVNCTPLAPTVLGCDPVASGPFSAGINFSDPEGAWANWTFGGQIVPDPVAQTPVLSRPFVHLFDPIQASVGQVGGSPFANASWQVDAAPGARPSCVGSGANLTCRFFAVGPVSLRATVTDANGVSSTSPWANFSVDLPLRAAPPEANPATLDTGGTFELDALATGGDPAGYSYAWHGLAPFECGGNAGPQITCLAPTPGSYGIGFNVTDDGGRTVAVSPDVEVNVSEPPRVLALALEPTTIELGQPIDVLSSFGSVAPGDFVMWSGLPAGCGVPSEGSYPCRPSASGNFTVQVTVVDPQGHGMASQAVALNVSPRLRIVELLPSEVPLIAGSTVELETQLAGGLGPFRYNYSGLPGSCSGTRGQRPTCILGPPGRYLLTTTVVDAAGYSANATYPLEVTALPAGPSPTAAPTYGNFALLLGGVGGALLVAVGALWAGRGRRRERTRRPG
jgi:hypothetical protein